MGFPVPGMLFFRRRRSWLNGDPENQFIAIGNTPYNTAGMIGAGNVGAE